ncbi:hypothetical protein PIB30_025163 [Stylosanthes scabra]|uniref:Uncharacterized protein n=1 Tax=Stylosanthes scabra TaxID=79078 RepID=A0ABU6Y8N2_9FABA|nr:hypothetical protein [Stylosanthes scabra]
MGGAPHHYNQDTRGSDKPQVASHHQGVTHLRVNRAMDEEHNIHCTSPMLPEEEGEAFSDMDGVISETEEESLNVAMEEDEEEPEAGNEDQRRATWDSEPVRVTVEDVLKMEFNNPEEAI